MANNNIFDDFLNAFEERKAGMDEKGKFHEQTIRRKETLMTPLRRVLKKMVDAQIVVENHEKYQRMKGNLEPKMFEIYEGPSSPSWAPGTSLYFDDPAEVEIAIPNEHSVQEMGTICIRVVSDHPDKYLFDKKFSNYKEALSAVMIFIGRSTLEVKKKEVLKELASEFS